MKRHVKAIFENLSLPYRPLLLFQNLQSAETILSDDENDSDDEVFHKLRMRKSGRQEMKHMLSRLKQKDDNFETEIAESDI